MEFFHLYIVTDTPEKAAQYFFGHGLRDVPSWTKIVSTIDEIAAIPNGARAVGVWFVPFDLRNERWVIRRWEVTIIGDHYEVLDAIRAWQAKKAASPVAAISQSQPEEFSSVPPEAEPAAPAPAPPPVIPAMQLPAPRWK